MKATYHEVRQLIENTNFENKVFTGNNEQPYVDELGYFASQGNNWAYRIGIAKGSDDKLYHVVTVFGGIRGYRRLHV